MIGNEERSLLAFTKASYTAAVTVAIPFSALIAAFPKDMHHIGADAASYLPSFIAFFICGILEARMESPREWYLAIPKIMLAMLFVWPVHW